MKGPHALLGSKELAASILLATTFLAQSVAAELQFKTAPTSNLDVSQLGRVAIIGDFDSASLFQYEEQSRNGINRNGSLSLLSRFPSGAFANLQTSDAYISSLCALTKGGKLQGVVVGGNFTSLGGVESPGLALFDPDTSKVTAIKGIDGRVNTVYCDDSGTAYAGGLFSNGNSSNALSWTTDGFKPLPFPGFNGAVTSITKASDGNIVFGGEFDGIGNSTTPKNRDGQQIPVASGQVTAGPSSTVAGLSDPKNVLCKSGNADGPGNAWLLADNSPGAWTSTFEFGFNPTLLRLRNTDYQGRGTKTFRFTAFPSNGIMNMTFNDQAGNAQYCDATCPLPQGAKTRDFRFVNSVGMNGFRLDVSEWYGAGGGFAALELLQDDIYTFAVNNFNEPRCSGITNPSAAQTTGTWEQKSSPTGVSAYLSATINGQINPDSTKVSFSPDISQSGNYSVTVFTPGCLQDNTCATRGRVDVTGNFQSSGDNTTVRTSISQTNDYDKYDQIYLGRIDAVSGSFKPVVTLAPSPGQATPLTVVTQRIRFELVTSSGGLNGLFEYKPGSAVDMNFARSTIDTAGAALDSGAKVNAVVNKGDLIYAGGDFRSKDADNFLVVGAKASMPPNGGLNGVVSSLAVNGDTIFIGGSFNATRDANGVAGLSGIAAFNTKDNTWSAVGAGIRGSAAYIVPFQLNLPDSKDATTAIAISGKFDQVNGFGGNAQFTVRDFAVWVPSKTNWLHNLNVAAISLDGILTAHADVPNNPPVFAGSVSSFDIGANGAIQVSGSDSLSLQGFPGSIQSSRSSQTRKRALAANTTGVVTGLYYSENNHNLTILAGHFSAKAANGSTIHNLAIINGKDSDKINGVAAGVSDESVIRAVGIQGNSLFAGGSITGNVHGNQLTGMFVYDIDKSDFAATQPAALQGSNVVVSAIAPRPKAKDVFVGGNFESAGSFPCPSLCVYDTARSQWTSPGSGFGGSIVSMTWVDEQHLLIAGSLNINGSATAFSVYDAKGQYFSAASGAGAPAGTITALSPGSANGTAAWIAGTSDNEDPFLAKYDGRSWTSVPGLGRGTVVRGLQIFTLRQKHDASPLMDAGNALMLFGRISLPNFGNVSAALYNGTAFTPFLLTGPTSDESAGAAGVFVSNPLNFFKNGSKRLALGFIVLIGLAIALALIALIVALGMLLTLLRRRRQGYVAAPSPVSHDNLRRVPPEELFGSLAQGGGGQSGRGWATATPTHHPS